MSKKSCYIAVFWLGDRRKEVNENKKDKLFYLKNHLSYLSNYSHNLNDIFLVFNLEKEHEKYLPEIDKIVPDQIQGSKVTIITRKNEGLSYGAWSDTFKIYKNDYDYYIFNEDDYFFVQNNWDQYLIDKFNSYNNCGYICPLVKEPILAHDFKKHAGHSTGISSGEALNKVLNKFGELPHYTTNNYIEGEFSQVIFSYSFIEVGYDIYDIRDDYRVFFSRTEPDSTDVWKLWFWNPEHLLLPADILTFNNFGEILPHTYWITYDYPYTSYHKPSNFKEAVECREKKIELHELRESKTKIGKNT